MCKPCGCAEVIKGGKEMILQRVQELIKELRITQANVDDYECIEAMSGMIAPLSPKHAEFYERAAWVEKLHEGMPHYESRNERFVQAYDKLYSQLPIEGEPKKISARYHQLERLVKEVDGNDIASFDPAVREGIKAVQHVHEDKTRAARLRARFGL